MSRERETLSLLAGRLDDVSLDVALEAARRRDWSVVDARLEAVRGRSELMVPCPHCRGRHRASHITCPVTARSLRKQELP